MSNFYKSKKLNSFSGYKKLPIKNHILYSWDMKIMFIKLYLKHLF